MKNRLYKIFTVIAALGILGACNKPNKADQLYNEMIDLESEFWFSRSISHVFLNRINGKNSQVVWSTNFHTAAPVPIGSVGPDKYTNLLKGIIQNDSIGNVMKMAVDDGLNVILVIGDGMGNMHMSLPVQMRHAKNESKPTMFEKIMAEGTAGYVLTSTARGLVTGSAASGTAIACGEKTLMNMVGVDTMGMELESVLDRAKQNNYSTAIVSDAGLTDATPASFYGHAVIRDWEDQIAMQMHESELIDVVLGGGGNRFIPNGFKLSELYGKVVNDFSSARGDSVNLIEKFRQNGYIYCNSKSDMQNTKSGDKVLGLFSGGGLPAPINRDENTSEIPTVTEMGTKALELISNTGNPYFIMIESARIDWESHDNDIGAVYQAVVEMDHMLESAYTFYEKNPENTLLIFTSDHETGGLEIAYHKVPYEKKETKVMANGEIWENVTNPLTYGQYRQIIERQKKSASYVLNSSKTVDELQQNIKNMLGIEITKKEAELLYFTMMDYQKYKD